MDLLYSVSRLSAVLFVSGMERSGFHETLYLIQTINAIQGCNEFTNYIFHIRYTIDAIHAASYIYVL